MPCNVWCVLFNCFISILSLAFVWISYEFFGRYGINRKRYYIQYTGSDVLECFEERGQYSVPCTNAIELYTINEYIFMFVITGFLVIMINVKKFLWSGFKALQNKTR